MECVIFFLFPLSTVVAKSTGTVWEDTQLHQMSFMLSSSTRSQRQSQFAMLYFDLLL